MFSFDLQRFANINTAVSGTVLSSAQISAGKDSLGNDITDYVKTISYSDTAITVTKGSGDTYAVTLSGGSGGFGTDVDENINKFFTPREELQDRYARAPFDSANVVRLDLSHLIDGTNFELDTENLTDGQVTRIRSGSASYKVNNGISRGYVEVVTYGRCQIVVVYSISSEGNYDYGGCIVTENAPNTTFTHANLKSANFFCKSGKYTNQTVAYTLAANKTYYLNFGYAKDSSQNSNDDRFYIHSIRVTLLDVEGVDATAVFTGANATLAGKGGIVPAPLVANRAQFLRGDCTWATPTNTTYSVATTTSSGLMSTSDKVKLENISKFFTPREEMQDRYARAPFDEANVVGLNLSNLIDGVNFELDMENLTDEQVTRIRSGSASYNVNDGISRGYVEVKTICKCTVTVVYSISSQSSYDYGGCIVTEGAPNTTFTLANLKAANFFYKAGNSANQTKTYTLAKNKTYYLNFGYAKNASTNSNDDRFYIHSITVTPDCVADNEAEHFFSVASDFQDAVISGIGGKFLPSVSSMTEVLDNSANFQYMANKYRLLINYPQPNIVPASSDTFLGGATTLSVGYEDPKNLIHSSLSDTNNTLASDTSTMTYTYNIVKLTETAGFLTYEVYNYSTSTQGARNVIPFNVATTGTVSLGSSTSIQAAAASGQTSEWYMIPAIYDRHHILFLTHTGSASGGAYKYTTIWFNGLTGAPTRIKALTNIGSWYNDANGKTDTFSYDKPFGVSVSQYTYNSSGDQTKELRYLLFHHGINKAAPVQYTYYTQTGDNVTIDKVTCDYGESRIFFSKNRENCYVLSASKRWPSDFLKLTPAQIDSAIKVFKINFVTPEIYETTLKVSDIINDIF